MEAKQTNKSKLLLVPSMLACVLIFLEVDYSHLKTLDLIALTVAVIAVCSMCLYFAKSKRNVIYK